MFYLTHGHEQGGGVLDSACFDNDIHVNIIKKEHVVDDKKTRHAMTTF